MQDLISNQDNFNPSSSKLAVHCVDFRPLEKGSLLGFATIRIPALRLTVKDVAVHSSHGHRWASLPAKPHLDRERRQIVKDGKPQYVNILQFDSKAVSDAFSAAVIAAVEALGFFKE